MTSEKEAILAAAASVSVDKHGHPRIFTLRDVKRELAGLAGIRLYDLWYSPGCNKAASGAKISYVLRASGCFRVVGCGRFSSNQDRRGAA